MMREMGSRTMRGMMSNMMQEEMSGLGTPDKVPIETRNTGNDQYIMERDTPMKFHYSFSRQNDGEMVNLLSDRAHVLASMSKRSAEMMNARSAEDVREIIDDPSYQEMMREEFSPYCYQLPRCDPNQKYRSACGACNNLRAPLYGKSFTPFRRIVSSKYEDGIEAPRTGSVLGGSLPSARDVSNAIHQERATSVNAVITPFVYSFGQFLDHDFTSTPLMEDENGNLIEDCCSNPERFECFSIPVSSNDPYFTDPTRKCIHVVRADIAPPLDCSSGIRQQQNQRSAFIDGTMIYGFNRAKEDSLRIGEMGFLKVSEDFPNTNGVLPKSEEDSCNIREEDRQSPEIQHCFDSGDHRQAENPLLTVIHTAFVRRHNLIATLLWENFGVTDDELLFQEAKRMVIAELQHITYNEFLPIVLNKRLMKMYNLKSKTAHDHVYNSSSDPRIINAFATAVFRFGHSLVRQVVGSDNGEFVYLDQLNKHFDRPRMTLTGRGYGHEYLTNWKARTGASQPDGYVVDAIRNKLFEAESSSLGGATLSFDLPAMNIQRGRDHGLPGYNVYREWCGLPRARHFGTWKLGLVDHDGREAAKLRSVYRHPDDIDLFAGGLSERRLRGALIGPTFACILAYQFQQLKVGDRYWYENPHPIYGFSTEQLKELKKVTLAKVICSTAEEDHIMDIQPNIMIRSSKKNSRMTCNQVLGGGHELGYHIDVFGTNFPGHRKPPMRNMQRSVRRLRRIYPYNPTLQHLFRNRLHIKNIARKVVIPTRRKHRRRIVVSRRRPLRFSPVLTRRRLPRRIVLG
ncbi:peroxidase-like protein [Saccostrea echinata]|uniref:peroxidase-like protein n=1 Tax=Saccostrea echinata TaxID=191078 RepID=UPI002A80DD0C|nr:peroxidase-like protein [Saccostrea echinata]